MIQVRYAGFWRRLGATVLDGLLLLLIVRPVLIAIYGPVYLDSPFWQPVGIWDALLSYALPALAMVLYWRAYQATPGKMVWSVRIVDADTGAPPSMRQLLLRGCGYVLSALPLGLGFLWIGIDRKKQGWHDRLANTMVIR